jgi:hypothetical protein
MLQSQGDREQELWRYRPPEGCIKQRYDKHSGYGCLSKKCEQGEQWNSDLAVSPTLAKLSDIHSENAGFEMYWLSPLTTIPIDIADSSVLPLLFLNSLCSLSGCPIINIHSCYQYKKLSWNIIHILGIIVPNFLPIFVMIMGPLAIFQAWIWEGLCYCVGVVFVIVWGLGLLLCGGWVGRGVGIERTVVWGTRW